VPLLQALRGNPPVEKIDPKQSAGSLSILFSDRSELFVICFPCVVLMNCVCKIVKQSNAQLVLQSAAPRDLTVSALAATGFVWTYYSSLITPQNAGSMALMACNAALGLVHGFNLVRKIRYLFSRHRSACSSLSLTPSCRWMKEKGELHF
jgi:hypothetical protein